MAFTAAESGHLDCLRYACEQGADSDDSVLYRAAASGHMDCVRYIHARGAPLDGRITPRAFLVSEDNWNCFRYTALYLPSWPDIPPEMEAWRGRVRATAATILHIVRRNRARRAAITIQRFWSDRHYAPGGRGHALAMSRINANKPM